LDHSFERCHLDVERADLLVGYERGLHFGRDGAVVQILAGAFLRARTGTAKQQARYENHEWEPVMALVKHGGLLFRNRNAWTFHCRNLRNIMLEDFPEIDCFRGGAT
jgi:hypothetical protein